MKAEKIYTIGSIITFFALLPALIYMEIRVLKLLPEYNFLLAVVIIMNILLLGFMGLEIYLLVRNWKKKKEAKVDIESDDRIKIEKEWENQEENNETGEERNE